jgi:hypothetical protein
MSFYDETQIKTMETHPNHPHIGHYYKSWARDGKVYRCVSFDYRLGFWMENVFDPLDRTNVVVAALGRTYKEVWSDNKIYAEISAKWEKTHSKGRCAHHILQANGFTCRYCLWYHECCACGRACACGKDYRNHEDKNAPAPAPAKRGTRRAVK